VKLSAERSAGTVFSLCSRRTLALTSAGSHRFENFTCLFRVWLKALLGAPYYHFRDHAMPSDKRNHCCQSKTYDRRYMMMFAEGYKWCSRWHYRTHSCQCRKLICHSRSRMTRGRKTSCSEINEDFPSPAVVHNLLRWPPVRYQIRLVISHPRLHGFVNRRTSRYERES
jgi:hypothetical protein